MRSSIHTDSRSQASDQCLAHQFVDLFGEEALKRVKGFSPPEMHLPNHPDTLHAFIQALNDCGYSWLMVQEHSVETQMAHL